VTPQAALIVPAALVLDTLVGDPPFRLHPVRLLGNLAAAAEKATRRILSPLPAGILTWSVVVGSAALASIGLLALGGLAGPWGRMAAGAAIVWASMAPRDLAVHALRVRRALERDGLAAGREAVSRVVGRDVERLDYAGVLRACVETVAEGLLDGVLSPLFWAFVAGPVGAAVYRAINTMDSMFGHRNERYILFGRVPARADDAANWLPARLSIPFIALAAALTGLDGQGALRIGLRDRRRHESPNSAHPEAAFAGALGLRLAGPAWYEGEKHDKPWIGDDTRAIEGADISRSVRLMYTATLLFTATGWAARWAVGLLWG
jgi:adenosylcobinamide-phosphate synthase